MVAVAGAVDTVLTLVAFASLAVAIWAVIDAATRSQHAFRAAGQNKVLWIVLPIVGALFLGILGGVVGVVYLAVIRPKVRAQGY